MKYNEIIFRGEIGESGKLEIDLKRYYPLNEVVCDNIEDVEYFFVDRWIKIDKPYNFKNTTARFINIKAKKGSKVKLSLGKGYYGIEKPEMTKEFFKNSGWTGGDGIFSFNIKNGNDSLNQEDAKTLFVFGDTLVGNVTEDNYRTEPLLMPNNTIAYLNGNNPAKSKVNFQFNTNEYDTVISYFEPDNSSIYSGTVPCNLIKYDQHNHENRYLSGYNPKKVEILFDLYSVKKVTHIEVLNYFDEISEKYGMSRRGIKQTQIYTASAQDEFKLLKDHTFKQATLDMIYEDVAINTECRYIKFVITPKQGIGNHYKEEDTKEVVFGINKVKIFTEERLLKDIHVSATSIMSKEKKHVWFWLQDGVVIDKELFLVPLVVGPDLSQPEGLQFRVDDVSMIKVPIVNDELDFTNATQKATPLAHVDKDSYWLFGAAFMANTKQAGAKNPDGYIYVYGYETTRMQRLLKVARTKPESISDFDTWEYYADGKWTSDITESSTLLNHISCEMSVTPITSGENEGKYLAVYTYNVNTTLIAYSIADTPWGPFNEPKIAYESLEKEKLGGQAYTYNAKAHPHMSTSDELLITYNVNTYSMDHNTNDAKVYHPRFVGLKYLGE